MNCNGLTSLASVHNTPIAKSNVHRRNELYTRQTSNHTCSGDFTFTNQEEIDNSILTNCTVLNGNIILDDASGEIILQFPSDQNAPLEVNGSIYCRNNSDLESLYISLPKVSETFLVQNATSLVNLTAEFFIVGTFAIQDCPKITITRLEADNITESLIIEGNMPSLSVVPVVFNANNITIRNVADVTFNTLEMVQNDFEISYCDELNTAVSFTSLKFIGGSFYIQNNPTLQYIYFQSLETIGNSLEMTNNPKLQFSSINTSATALSLQNVGSIELSGDFPNL